MANEANAHQTLVAGKIEDTTLIYMRLIYQPIWFRGSGLQHRPTHWELHVGDELRKKSNKVLDYT